MRTLGLLWEWSHTFGGHAPIRAEFVRTSANTRLKALAGEAFRGPGWYGDGRLYVEALDASDDPHLRVSVFERDPRPRMRELCEESDSRKVLIFPRPDPLRAVAMSVDRVQYRLEMTTVRHAAAALALAVNAGIPGAMRCYPTALGYEVYCKEFRDWNCMLPVPMMLIVESACRAVPGFLGVRFDDHNYVTAVVACSHPGRERA